MKPLATIRTFKTRNFTVSVDALEEQDVDLSWDETGETLKGLNDGSLVVFCVRVAVYLNGSEVGTDYLGQCIYKDFNQFQDHLGIRPLSRAESEKRGYKVCFGSYFSDMVSEAISEARKTIGEMQSVHIRN